MAGGRHRAKIGDEKDHLDLRPLLRLAAWGFCALVALFAAVMAGQSEVGVRRTTIALATMKTPRSVEPQPSEQLAARSPSVGVETTRLEETVRTLAADRDRLVDRIAVIERNIEDLTGSITRAPPAAHGVASLPAPAGTPELAPSAAPPVVSTVSTGSAAAAPESAADRPAAPEANVPLPRFEPMSLIQSYVTATIDAPRLSSAPGPETAPPSTTTRAEFAVDLGAAPSINGLRALWEQLKARPGLRLDRLQPLVFMHAGTRPATKEMRLIVGPLASAAAAARICAGMAGAGLPCRPTVFNGQRLALH